MLLSFCFPYEGAPLVSASLEGLKTWYYEPDQPFYLADSTAESCIRMEISILQGGKYGIRFYPSHWPQQDGGEVPRFLFLGMCLVFQSRGLGYVPKTWSPPRSAYGSPGSDEAVTRSTTSPTRRLRFPRRQHRSMCGYG